MMSSQSLLQPPDATLPPTTVVNVRVAHIRLQGYDNLRSWTSDENNVYIGRAGVVFIKKGDKNERFPRKASIWANPFKIGKGYTRETCLIAYEHYIRKKIEEDMVTYNLNKLRGKTLGCWCHPEPCHGDVLVRLLN